MEATAGAPCPKATTPRQSRTAMSAALSRALGSANNLSPDPTETPLRPRHLFALAGIGAVIGACGAHAQTADDPYESLNRRLYDSAIKADRRFFRPTAHVYRALTPGPVGGAIHNFVTNLGEPVVVANDLLQLRLHRAADDFMRLLTNTTFGIGGLTDLAVTNGLPHHDNDFGVTLGRWGAQPGPYLFLPFLGPSTVRDAIGTGVDVALNPLTFVRFPGRLTLEVSSSVVGALDGRVRQEGELEAATADAADPYATIRSDYLQSREAMVRGEDAAPALAPIDEPAPAAAPGPSARRDSTPTMKHLVAPSIDAPSVEMAAVDDPNALIATARPCDIDPASLAPAARGA